MLETAFSSVLKVGNDADPESVDRYGNTFERSGCNAARMSLMGVTCVRHSGLDMLLAVTIV